MLERRRLAVMGLDEGMRHGAIDRHAIARLGGHCRRAREPGEIGGPRRHQPGLRPMRAAQAEIDERLARRRQRHARGLRCNQRLEMQDVDQPRLHQLGLGQRRGDANNRLVGEDHGPLRRRMDLAGETQIGQPVDETLREMLARRQPVQLGLRKARLLQEPDGLLQPRRHQKPAPFRQPAHEKLEHRRLRHAMLQIGLQHGELIEVGKQQALAGVAGQEGVVAGGHGDDRNRPGGRGHCGRSRRESRCMASGEFLDNIGVIHNRRRACAASQQMSPENQEPP
jgi:hypothetical protein